MPTRRDSRSRSNEPIDSNLPIVHSILGAAVVVLTLSALSFVAVPPVTAGDPGITNKACPPGAIPVAPGTSIQDAVDPAAEGAAFCLKNGTHRMQAVRPRQGQSFHGEGQTVLNGSRLITEFVREGR